MIWKKPHEFTLYEDVFIQKRAFSGWMVYETTTFSKTNYKFDQSLWPYHYSGDYDFNKLESTQLLDFSTRCSFSSLMVFGKMIFFSINFYVQTKEQIMTPLFPREKLKSTQEYCHTGLMVFLEGGGGICKKKVFEK